MAFKDIRSAAGIQDPTIRTVVEDLVREVAKLTGQRGLDRVVTRAELVSAGLIKVDTRGVVYDPSQTPANAFTDAGYDLPDTPTGVSVSSNLLITTISWDPPTYRKHAFTEVWVSATDDISAGRLLTSSRGSSAFFTLPSDIGTSGYVWIRNVSTEGVAGPFDSASGSGTAVSNIGAATGIIVLWSGALGAIPAGWSVCDGTGGTVDMQDYLPIGAGSLYSVGTAYGALTDTSDGPSATTTVDNNADGSTVSVGSSAHTHDVDILPPSRALYFIQYTG